MSRADEIRTNLAAVEARITAACGRAGRKREEVTLVAVTKVFPASDVDLAIAAAEAGAAALESFAEEPFAPPRQLLERMHLALRRTRLIASYTVLSN